MSSDFGDLPDWEFRNGDWDPGPSTSLGSVPTGHTLFTERVPTRQFRFLTSKPIETGEHINGGLIIV